MGRMSEIDLDRSSAIKCPLRTALEAIEQRANESGTGELGLLETIHAMHKIARDALTQKAA